MTKLNLKEWIEKEDDNEELLPICHTTRWKYFEKILEKDNLSKGFSKFPDPNPKVLKEENVVYLFYGLPFYIYEIGDGDEINSEVTEDVPIGLIFKPKLADNVDRFYPFDTGALLAEKYKNILDINDPDELKLYEVGISDGRELQKLVKHYYSSNENYCFGELDSSVSASCPKEENLLRLFAFGNKSKIDLRNRAVEIHSLHDIFLSKNLLAIVLPRLRTSKFSFLVNNIKLKHPSVKIVYYNDLKRYNSESIRDAVINSTIEFYNKDVSMDFSYNNLG